MDAKTILEALDLIRKDMEASDPLAQRGVPLDAVCCMSSHTYYDLKQKIEAQHPFTMTGSLVDRVRELVRRDVWIFDDLAYGRIEYMMREQALAKDLGQMLRIKQVFKSDSE